MRIEPQVSLARATEGPRRCACRADVPAREIRQGCADHRPLDEVDAAGERLKEIGWCLSGQAPSASASRTRSGIALRTIADYAGHSRDDARWPGVSGPDHRARLSPRWDRLVPFSQIRSPCRPCRPFRQPPGGIGGAFFSGFSATIASVVTSRPATEAASCSAVRTTLVGSMMPAAHQVLELAGLRVEAPVVLVACPAPCRR